MAKKHSRRSKSVEPKAVHVKDRVIWIVLILTAVFTIVQFLPNFTGFFVAEPPITIDGNFDDWTPVLNNSANVVYDGPWNYLTDLDRPKTQDDLVRSASTYDKDYIYFYFERTYDHSPTRIFVYVDSNNNGLMEAGEPVLDIKWPKDEKAYTLSIGIYKYMPASNATGDTMDCQDGCTMPGKEKCVWKYVERLRGNSADSKKLEVRMDWDWLNMPIKPECRSCKDIFSLTMQLSEPLNISIPANVSIYDKDHHLLQSIPITPENTTFVITDVKHPEINVTIDGTEFSEVIDTSCNEPIGENMTFDEFDIISMDASQKTNCVAPAGFEPNDLKMHISSSKGGKAPDDVVDNMNGIILTTADTTLPAINLLSPENDSTNNNGYVTFQYNVNDADSGIASCSLIINGAVDQTNDIVMEGITQSFSKSGMAEGTYFWSINCTDNSANANTGFSETRVLQIVIPIDSTPPSIGAVQPSAGINLPQYGGVPISAAVTDNVAVSTVLATITLPNGTAEQVTLTDANSDSIYDFNFTNTALTGQYNATITASDASANTNNAATWFNILPVIDIGDDTNTSYGVLNITVIIIDAQTNAIVYNSTAIRFNTTIMQGMYHVMIIPPPGYPVKDITFWNVNVTTSVNQIVDLANLFDIRYLDPSLIYSDVFTANLVLTAPYSHATIQFIANAASLYKCRVFDFEDQICYGQWIKILDNMVPGELTSINLTKGDPAFGEGSTKLVLTTIKVDGNMGDWDAVLDSPSNVMIDGVSGINDNDTVKSAAHDITKFAFTWDENNLYSYFRRVYIAKEKVTLLVYLDLGMDGYMNSTDKVLRFVYQGDSRRYDSYLHGYAPNATADLLTGDGVAMPGSLTNQSVLATNVMGGDPTSLELECNASWSRLGVPAGTPFKFHVSVVDGEKLDIPKEVTDNTGAGSTLLADVLITPDNTKGAKANSSMWYNHTIKNVGNYYDTFDINASSSKGFAVQLLWPNGTALTDTDNDSVVDTGKLNPGQTINITAKITVPSGTEVGTKDITRITAMSSLDTLVSSIAYDTTFVGSITITPSYFGRIANNTVLAYNHTVKNNLGASTVIDLNASSNQNWTIKLLWPNGTALTDTDSSGKVDVGNVTAGGEKTFLLQLTVPSSATDSTIDSTTISANSSTNPSDSGYVTDRTTVAKRVETDPDHDGQTGIGTSIFYEHEVFNNWNNSDVIDITNISSKGWPVIFYKSDKTTLLNDTNNNSIIDTGSLSYAGGSAKIVAKISVPMTAAEDDKDNLTITGKSASSTAADNAVDNTTASILVIYNDSIRTQKDYYFKIGETAYAKAYGLLGISKVYFVWVGGNGTMQRTSPNINVDANKQATDEFLINCSCIQGNGTLILYNLDKNAEITRRDFAVAEITPPDVRNLRPVSGTNYNQSNTVVISANVTDGTAVGAVLANTVLPNSTTLQIVLTDANNDSVYDGNFTNTNLLGRYNVTIIANDTLGNVNNTEKTWFNIINGTQSDTIKPNVTFNSQSPADLTSNNILGQIGLNITYNITDNVALNLPTIILYYKNNETASDINYYINGTAVSGYRSIAYTSNTSSTFLFRLDDNQVYPATYNFAERSLELTAHLVETDGDSKDYHSMEFYNVSNSAQYSFFEIMANRSSGTGGLRIYYCNSSYGFSNRVPNNPSCTLFYTITNNTYDHRHSVNSAHMIVPFAMNTTSGKIGTVYVTPVSYFMSRGIKYSNWNIYYITNSTRTAAFRTSGNEGNAWASQTYTIDAHLHQYDGTDRLWYYACANDTSNNQNCTSPLQDLIDLAGLPPTAPNVYNPVSAAYSGNVVINYTAALSPNGYAITFYNISLVNSDLTFNKTIRTNNLLNLSYVWNSTGTNNGEYLIRVVACDNMSQCSYGYSENFTINNNVPILTIYSPLNRTYTTRQILVNFTADSYSNLWFYNGTANVSYTTPVYVNASEGVSTFIFYANSSAGIVNSTSLSFTIDTAGPIFTNLANQTILSNASLAYTITATDPSGISCFTVNDTVRFKINCGGLLQNATSLSQGMYWISITVNDTVGNANSGIIYVNVTNVTYIDTIPPAITIVSPLNQTYTTTVINFSVTLDKTGSWCGYSLDNAANISMTQTSATSFFATNSTMGQGSHSVKFSCNSTFGYMNTTLPRYFVVDTIAPTINLISPINTTYNNRTLLVNISTTGASFVWFYNGTANETYTIPVYRTFAEGVNTLIVYANDTAGNLNQTSVTFTTKTTAPTITNTTTVPTLPFYNTGSSQNISVNFTSSDFPINVTFNLYNSSGAVVNTLGPLAINNASQLPVIYTIPANLTNGVYVLNMTVADSVNNTVTSNLGNFTVDKTPPSILIISPANTTYNNRTQMVNISTTGAASIWYNWNGTNVTYTIPVYVTFAEGSNTLRVYANDSAGNFNATSVMFSTKTTAPTITNTTTYPTLPFNNNGSSQNISVNFTSSDFPINVTFNVYNSSGAVVSTQGPITVTNSSQLPIIYTIPTNLTDGVYTLNMTVADSVNNTITSNLGNFTVNKTFPSISIISPTNRTYNNRTLLVNISKAGASNTWFNWDGVNTSYTVPVYVTFNEGTNTLRAYANNSAGNVNSTFVTFVTSTIAPTITSTTIDPYDPAVGNSTFINASATGATGISGIFANITLPNGTVITIPLPATYVPALTGRYNVTIWANDTAGNVGVASQDYFIAGSVLVNIQFNAVDHNFIGLPVNLTIYFAGTGKSVHAHDFIGTQLDTHTTILYDLYYAALDNNVTVRLNNVNLTLNNNNTLGLDRTTIAGYLVTYGVYNTYNITGAIVTISYAGTGYTDENNLGLYRCSDWNFTARTCNSGWASYSGTQDKVNDSYTLTVTGFSAFSVKQESVTPPTPTPSTGGGGGGGAAAPKENISAPGAAYQTTAPTGPYYIGDFARTSVYAYNPAANELWIFTYKGVNHTVLAVRIVDGIADLQIDSKTEFRLYTSKSGEFDVDGDGSADVRFILNSAAFGGRANIILELVKKPLITISSVSYMQTQCSLLLIAIAILLLLFILSRKKRKKLVKLYECHYGSLAETAKQKKRKRRGENE